MRNNIYLNSVDYKLLAKLYHNQRESTASISKATHLSRDQVDYRIRKYVKEGIIKEFFTVFDYSRLGYTCFAIVYIKFEKLSAFEVFSKKLEYKKNCISWGRMFGSYDLYLNTIFKNEEELSNFLAELLGSHECPISEYLLFKPFFAELYPLKMINNSYRDTFSLVNNQSEVKIDDKEKLMLKIISKDGRAKLVNIASELKISSELTFYKLKRLQKKGIIQGSRIQFDMRKLGFQATDLLLTITKLSQSLQNKLKEFARTDKNTNSFMMSLSKPNCMIQFFHSTEEELRNSIARFQEQFKDEKVDMQILLAETEEGLIDSLPFL